MGNIIMQSRKLVIFLNYENLKTIGEATYSIWPITQ